MSIFSCYRLQLAPADFPRLFQKKLWKGLDNVHRGVSLRAIDGLRAKTYFQPLRPHVPRKLSCAQLFLLRSISVYGFRPIDPSREPPRYRNLLELLPSQIISRWFPRPSGTQYFSQSQPNAQLAHLGRLGPVPHWACAQLYAHESFAVALQQTVYAFDATTIDLCRSLFPWANFADARPPSNSTPYSICAATFPVLCIFPREKWPMSRPSIISCWKPARTM